MKFFDRPDVSYIGRFQLENLVSSRAPFLFYDLRKSQEQEISAEVQKLIASAERLDVNQAIDVIRARVQDKAQPIVLICEKGKRSTKVAGQLEGEAFINVCVVEGGIQGLKE